MMQKAGFRRLLTILGACIATVLLGLTRSTHYLGLIEVVGTVDSVSSIDALCDECKAATVGSHFSCVDRIKRYMAGNATSEEAQKIVSGEYSECSVCAPERCKMNGGMASGNQKSQDQPVSTDASKVKNGNESNLRLGETMRGLPIQSAVSPKQVQLEPLSLLSDTPSSIFYPWRDLTATPNREDGSTVYYSHHLCATHDTEDHVPDYAGRTCRLHNIYFRPSDQTFHYYASPEESRAWESPELLQNELKVISAYYMNGHTKPVKDLQIQFQIHFNETLPVGALVASINQTENDKSNQSHQPFPVFLLYRFSYSFNIGHLLWDDLLSLFTMLDYFGYAFPNEHKSPHNVNQAHIQPVSLHLDNVPDPFYRCNPPKFRWDKCRPMIQRIYPSLARIQPVDVNGTGDALRVKNLFQPGGPGGSAVNSTNVMVRLPIVIAGPGQLAQFGCGGACATQWTGRLYRFRKWILGNLFGPTFDEWQEIRENPRPHKILVSLPVGNTHKGIELFEDIIPVLQGHYGNDSVAVVDFAKLPMKEQARLVLSTQVLLTNQGGGSMTSTFLRRGSTLLLFHTDEKYDLHFYSAQGYIHTKWLRATSTPVETVLNNVELGLQRFNTGSEPFDSL